MAGACQAKRGGITPMIVRGVSPTVTTWPRTSSRPPNFSSHAPWASTTTGVAPGFASSSVKTRPLQRPHAEGRERVRRHLGDRDDVGAGGGAHDRVVGGADDDRLEHRLRLQQVDRLVLSHRAAVVAVARLRVHHEDVDHPIGLCVRERVEEDVAQRAVDHRDAADAQRQRQHGGDRETGAASQHTRVRSGCPATATRAA